MNTFFSGPSATRPSTPWRSALLAPSLVAGALFVGALPLGWAAPSFHRLAQDPVTDAATAVETTPVTDALERSLAAVNADRISADLHFLASDEMRGRDTPSAEQRIAARFLRARLQQLGFQPGAEGGYFHEYSLAWRAIDPQRSVVKVSSEKGERSFAFGVDYFLESGRDAQDLDLSGGIVWAGQAAGADLEALAAAGKWLLCLDGKESVGRRRIAARRAGALGLLVMPAADYDGAPYAERFRRSTDALVKGTLSYPKDGPEGQTEVFASLALSRESGLALLGLANVELPPEGIEAGLPLGTDLGVTATEERRAAGDSGRVVLENVCGFWPGSDPELEHEVLLISAHYDHVGARGEEIYNGADDNASGTSGLLAIAEGLAARGPLARSVMLIWVSAEEKGLLGSRAWSDKPWLPGERRAAANLNIDMIGRNAGNELHFTPSRERGKQYGRMSRLVEELAPLEGFTSLKSADMYYERSDQAMFARLGIPVLFLFTDVHEDYHKPTDTPDKIDYDKVRRVVRLALRLLDQIQTGPLTAE